MTLSVHMLYCSVFTSNDIDQSEGGLADWIYGSIVPNFALRLESEKGISMLIPGVSHIVVIAFESPAHRRRVQGK